MRETNKCQIEISAILWRDLIALRCATISDPLFPALASLL